MTKILLIRHGEAAKTPESVDPDLTERGWQQARRLAQHFTRTPPIALASSPKARTQQTAQPLAQLWQRPVNIEQAVTEIPSPEGLPTSERRDWIRRLLDSNWDDGDRQQVDWRRGIARYLLQLERDTAIFCHFMVINSVVAHIRGDRRIQQFRPDYASVTELRLQGGRLKVLRLGEERRSRIL
ncbi:histidine phosphatase family protein [Microbulbifer rhizosphaerae]|uniref:Broad specificity phosphatase PhoE n=1 Tax=Microbulbifer rhizosphaerae TaxID=1562603 RepID=A0A7W4Z9D8_9GAMM|nr:histidine phosphatase family protein [Microbulbifer rhizosphaerae]MBB3061723.1 broad specificity phosphatase PhoE [Microbulbifer rhizosphaerae]